MRNLEAVPHLVRGPSNGVFVLPDPPRGGHEGKGENLRGPPGSKDSERDATSGKDPPPRKAMRPRRCDGHRTPPSFPYSTETREIKNPPPGSRSRTGSFRSALPSSFSLLSACDAPTGPVRGQGQAGTVFFGVAFPRRKGRAPASRGPSLKGPHPRKTIRNIFKNQPRESLMGP